MAEKPYLLLAKGQRKIKAPKPKLVNFTRKSGAFKRENAKDLKYAQFEPLYQLWLEYFREIAFEQDGKVRTSDPEGALLRADFHGALLLVAEAENPTQIGLHGIVALETRHTFQLITKKDKIVVIPKKGSAFQFAFEGHVFTLFGDAMRQIPALRGKKGRGRLTVPYFLR